MGFGCPVSQAVCDHLDHPHVVEVERVAGARIIDVIARVIGQQSVVRSVVDALEGQGRTKLVTLGCMVVDDIKNDFEPRIVKACHHFLEFAQSLFALMRVARIRREKLDGIVSPIKAYAYASGEINIL